MEVRLLSVEGTGRGNDARDQMDKRSGFVVLAEEAVCATPFDTAHTGVQNVCHMKYWDWYVKARLEASSEASPLIGSIERVVNEAPTK